ncbi:hypothetical protein DPMN_033166 [Dreissena polymorpha]|uniref:Uncharacterized protein n=1 Tax=Dreissena polymorpha TaxID=45954 RepID=A0A9D4M5E9_DREPO|nr:hypothetical protein DPMN_033166 [Dreissena polymorpha]
MYPMQVYSTSSSGGTATGRRFDLCILCRYIPLQVLVVRSLEKVIIAMFPMQEYSTSSSGGAAIGRR